MNDNLFEYISANRLMEKWKIDLVELEQLEALGLMPYHKKVYTPTNDPLPKGVNKVLAWMVSGLPMERKTFEQVYLAENGDIERACQRMRFKKSEVKEFEQAHPELLNIPPTNKSDANPEAHKLSDSIFGTMHPAAAKAYAKLGEKIVLSRESAEREMLKKMGWVDDATEKIEEESDITLVSKKSSPRHGVSPDEEFKDFVVKNIKPDVLAYYEGIKGVARLKGVNITTGDLERNDAATAFKVANSKLSKKEKSFKHLCIMDIDSDIQTAVTLPSSRKYLKGHIARKIIQNHFKTLFIRFIDICKSERKMNTYITE